MSVLTEKDGIYMNGYLGIVVIMLCSIMFVMNIVYEQLLVSIIFIVLAIFICTGLTYARPNEAAVVLFFGKYIGTIRQEGLFVTLPFTRRVRKSLRIKQYETNKIVVTNVRGVRVEASVVVTWQIVDTAKAHFSVEQFDTFFVKESELALRNALVHSLDEATLLAQEKLIAERVAERLTAQLSMVGTRILDVEVNHFMYDEHTSRVVHV